jgi:hypothetical protein
LHCDGSGTLGFQLFLRAETTVSFAFGEQALRVFGIDRQAVRLSIRSVGAFAKSAGWFARTLVPIETKPIQVFNKLVFVASFGAFEIRVFNAKDELAARASGEKPVIKCGARIAHVE